MSKALIRFGLSTAFLLIAAASVGAQSQQDPGNRAFIDVNVGAQPQRHTLNTSSTFSLYDEVATVTSNQPIPNGAIFEVNGGYRIRQHLAVAVGVSSFRRRSGGALSASIPDPLFFNQPRIVSGQTSGLDHVERAVHVQALWIIPVTDRIDVAFSAGPSFIHLAQQLATVSVSTGTQDAVATIERQTGTAIGANVGFDGSYMFTRRFGLGIFARYAAGSVDLPAASGVKVGGFRTGLGFRVHF